MKVRYYLFFLLSILAFILFLFGFNASINGRAIDSSMVNITIETTLSINFTVDQIDFGSGKVDSGSGNATIDTLGNVIGGNWTPISGGFIIDNLGNTNVSLNLKSGKNAAELLGGTLPQYLYNLSNREPGSCKIGEVSLGEWHDMNKTGEGDMACSVFNYLQISNSVRIDVRLIIPSDARVGYQADTLTATGTSLA